MQPANPDPTEERLNEALATIDEALRLGSPAAASGTAEFSPELKPELSSVQPVLRQCRQHRKRRLETPRPQTALPQGLPAKAFFGRYQTIRQLGRGGFGMVFLAYDPILKRRVALKVPREEVLATLELRERFLTEAQAMAQLQHSHLVPIHDFGEHGVICYLVTAFCDQGNLEQWLKQRSTPVSPAAAATLVRDLALAVRYMHDRGILHRDLKPANILFSDPQAATGDLFAEENQALPGEDAWEPAADGSWPMTAKISDFGLVKVFEGPGGSTAGSTSLGTPAYMAPEQARGERAMLGPPTDVYALGAVLYEMLTGTRPFPHGTMEETMKRVVSEVPVSPETRRPGLPRELAAICMKCLAKEPAQRYAAADALAKDLDRWLRGSAEAAPAWHRRWRDRARASVNTLRTPLAAAIGIAVVLLVFQVLLWPRPAPVMSAIPKGQSGAALTMPLTLINNGQAPAHARWVSGTNGAFRSNLADACLTVEALNAGALELAADPACRCYRFSLQVRHDNSLGFSEGGLYFGCREQPTATPKPQGAFLTLTLADRGPAARTFRGPNDEPVSRVNVHCRLVYEEPKGNHFVARLLIGKPKEFTPAQPVAIHPGPWRRLAVEVSPTRVKMFWAPDAVAALELIGDFSVPELQQHLISHARAILGHNDMPADFNPRSGLGLFVTVGQASFRDAILEPLAGGN